MAEDTKQFSEPISEELKMLVIARLNLIPNNVKVSVGADGEFTRAELIQRVEQGDRVGLEIIQSQLEFLRALGSGKLLDELTPSRS